MKKIVMTDEQVDDLLRQYLSMDQREYARKAFRLGVDQERARIASRCDQIFNAVGDDNLGTLADELRQAIERGPVLTAKDGA